MGQHNLVLRDDLTHPDICWKSSAAAYTSSIKFLECIEDRFLTQMFNVPTRNEALLGLLLTNQEKLLCDISVNDSLGCSDHNIVEFGILLSMLKVTSKTKGLDFSSSSVPLDHQQSNCNTLAGLLQSNSFFPEFVRVTETCSNLAEIKWEFSPLLEICKSLIRLTSL